MMRRRRLTWRTIGISQVCLIVVDHKVKNKFELEYHGGYMTFVRFLCNSASDILSKVVIIVYTGTEMPVPDQ